MATRRTWPPERVEEIAAWKKKNNASWKDTGEHFGVNAATLQGVYSRFKLGKGHFKKRKKKFAKARKKMSSEFSPPEFVDFHAQTESGRAIVIVCKISDVSSILKEI